MNRTILDIIAKWMDLSSQAISNDADVECVRLTFITSTNNLLNIIIIPDWTFINLDKKKYIFYKNKDDLQRYKKN